MNREPNKEIDILLRKLSKKQNGNLTVDGDLAAAAEEHLDADELNAYAEQALPPALRARYTEHLADCGRCRSIVTQLSLTSPVVISQEIVEQPVPSRLKTFVASLFSPLVMRYAVPAMAVILVAAIAWIAVRGPARSVDLAQKVVERQPESVAQLEDRAPVAEPTTGTNAAATADANQKRENKQANVSRDEAPATTATATKAPEEAKEGEVRAKRDEPAPPPAAAPAAAAGAVAAPKPVNQADKNQPVDQKKTESDVARVQSASEAESRPYARAQKAGPSPPAKTQTQDAETKTNESATIARRERAATAAEKQKDEARDDDVETRTVAGHRFKRRGSVWTDVLYDSNRSTVNVSRGSEQYRALVGDEPALRTIADQLSGTVIVVWKNQAYRIR